jgi:hypothetical protein
MSEEQEEIEYAKSLGIVPEGYYESDNSGSESENESENESEEVSDDESEDVSDDESDDDINSNGIVAPIVPITPIMNTLLPIRGLQNSVNIPTTIQPQKTLTPQKIFTQNIKPVRRANNVIKPIAPIIVPSPRPRIVLIMKPNPVKPKPVAPVMQFYKQSSEDVISSLKTDPNKIRIVTSMFVQDNEESKNIFDLRKKLTLKYAEDPMMNNPNEIINLGKISIQKLLYKYTYDQETEKKLNMLERRAAF